MNSQKITNYIDLTPGIIDLLYQRGYNYFVWHSLKDYPFCFEASFYKERSTAKLIFDLLNCEFKFYGHIVDDDAQQMVSWKMLMKFLIRDVQY